MLPQEELERIRAEAETICKPYGIGISSVQAFPDTSGGGAWVSIRLPEGMGLDANEVVEASSRLEQLPGVARVFVTLT